MESRKETMNEDVPRPLVSIITPTFNRSYLLGRTIESVTSQTYPNWELIIVDDGSTDNTPQLVTGFKESSIQPKKTEVLLQLGIKH